MKTEMEMSVVLLVLFFAFAKAVSESRAALGYSTGLIPDCPGSWKPADIRPETLRNISISVMGRGGFGEAKLTTYNYYRVKHLVKHPDVDFKNKKTLLFVPGYLDNNGFPIGRGMGDVYQKLGYNVLILDIVYFTTDVFPVISRLMRPVGKHVAELLATLTTLGLDPKDLEILGLSLGAQTMSFIAKNYREITGKNVSTLIALEPTGPCFRNLGPDQRLDKSDADWVLTVITNMDGFGLAVPTGHLNFYVNGGEWQPGEVWWFPCGLMCSHSRMFLLWISALLNPGKFLAMKCDSVQQAREASCYDIEPKVSNTLDRFTDRSKPGLYYLATSNRYPFYLGKKGLERSGEIINKFTADLNKVDMMWV